MNQKNLEVCLVIGMSLISSLSIWVISDNIHKSRSIEIEAVQLLLPTSSTPAPSPKPSIKPSPTPITIKNDMTQISPDGAYVLKLVTKQTLHQNAYTLIATKQDTHQDFSISSGSIANSNQLVLPFNTWSPDNKYVFLTQINAENNEYLVYPVITKQETEPILISELFQQKVPNYKIIDVTGWAASNLLIVNTQTSNGDQGPSFWFNVTNKSFTRLSTLFL